MCNLLLLNLFCVLFFIFGSVDEPCIIINIPSRTLEVIKNTKIIKIYPVGVGKADFPTPIGDFKVISKIVNPGWENPYKPLGKHNVKSGPLNPLGTRWIGFYQYKAGQYGIHGTNNPRSVGKYSSHGCIRMYIKDAEDLFDRIEVGNQVKVRYFPYRLIISNNLIYLKKYPNVYKLSLNCRFLILQQLEIYVNQGYEINWNKVKSVESIKNGDTLIIGRIKDIRQ